MKTVAQTVIEADRFYTIAARTGSVIEAAASTKNEETVWANTTTSPNRSGRSSAWGTVSTASATALPASSST